MPTVEDLTFTIAKLEFCRGDSLILKFGEAPPSYAAVMVATHAIREALVVAGHGQEEIPILVFGPGSDLGVLMFSEQEAVS